MDKEPILRKYYEEFVLAHPEISIGMEDFDNDIDSQQIGYKAMDEYAKRQAIDFAEWIAETVAGNYADGVRMWDLKRSTGHTPLTTEQLYSLYLLTQQK
jgi:hypothetical protein